DGGGLGHGAISRGVVDHDGDGAPVFRCGSGPRVPGVRSDESTCTIDRWLVERLVAKTLVNRPRQVGVERYEAALAEYLDLVTGDGTVRAVYRVGSLGAPGLSDIDLILVMRDSHRDVLCRYNIERLGAEARYVFSHDALFTDA